MPDNQSLLVPISKSTSKTKQQLILFPHAGGSSSSFRLWKSLFPNNIDIYAYQLPGRGVHFNRPPITTFSEAINIALELIVPLLEKTTIFFGHSLGALISYEICRQLSPEHSLKHLFVSGRGAPNSSAKKGYAQLSDEQLIDTVMKLGGMETTVIQDKELIDLTLPIIRSDFMISESYTFQPDNQRISFPITALAGNEDKGISRKSLLTWEQHTCASFQYRYFPGNHFYINEAYMEVTTMIMDAFNADAAKD